MVLLFYPPLALGFSYFCSPPFCSVCSSSVSGNGVTMNLILRFILWLIRGLAFLIFYLLLLLAEALWRFILLPVIVLQIQAFRSLVFFSLRASVNGPRRFLDRVAGE